MALWSSRRRCGCWGTLLSQALAGEFDPISIVDEPIQDRIGNGGVADNLVPALDRDLAGHDGGASFIAVFDDLEQITPLIVIELLGPPIIENEKIHAGQS